ncbi:SRPBCC family protein [Cryptosporangium phraense]|uniref:Polyketide cyclase n=1 Tax=Cryptosporangium phraense TaxID=2593070 RepID=A0A545AYX9_9ACTN|nr:SRPBCC family protein [Cryptosporangium phraense]TQS46498.1 polyketide cyclase [Cryptosporangium phraense]
MTDRSVMTSTFTLERTYSAPPSIVFGAWADPETKRSWFAPTADAHDLDFRVGGQEVNTAGDMRFTSTYHDIVDGERIVYTSTLANRDETVTVSLTSVQFVADGDGTRLELTEQNSFLDGHEQPSWREQGTATWLDALGAAVSGS